jgi:hypothetical protein
VTNKSDKERQRRLEQQQAEDRARALAAMNTAAAPRPLETAIDTEALDWINNTTGKNGPLDVSSLKQMKPYLGLYDNAVNRQRGERMGIGALRMGQMGDNSGLSTLLAQQSQDQRQQDAAGGLENAYRMTDAQMRGNIMPLLGLQQNRTMGLASLASGNSQNSTNQWANFRPQPSFWQTLLLNSMQGASQVGKAFMGGG